MRKRTLGRVGLAVSELGLGCMGMTYSYGSADEGECLRTLQRSLELGMSFWDSAEMYGPFTNETLLGKALKGRRDQVVVATKFAFRFDAQGKRLGLDSSPAHIRESVEGSLRRLGTDYIDLYYQHRVDPNTPIEDTVGAMAQLVEAGKVRYIGLSEAGPATIRRAHKIHPLAAVQSEYSLWERSIEAKVLPVLRELGIALVAYSPMGRGFLTGTIPAASALPAGDGRKSHPRFQPDNHAHNLRLVEVLKRIAERHRATPAQVALAWVLRQGPDVVPIPGTKRVRYLEENARAADVTLDAAALAELDHVLQSIPVAGARFPEEGMRMIDTAE